jgi:hypothetical protein
MRPHHKHQHGAIFFAIVVSFYSRSDFRVQWRIRAAAGDARLRLSLVGMHFRPIQASRWQPRAVRRVSWRSAPARWLAPACHLGDLSAHGEQRAQPPTVLRR